MACPGFVDGSRSSLLLLRGSLSLSLVALELNIHMSQYQMSWGDHFQGLCDFSVKIDKEQLQIWLLCTGQWSNYCKWRPRGTWLWVSYSGCKLLILDKLNKASGLVKIGCCKTVLIYTSFLFCVKQVCLRSLDCQFRVPLFLPMRVYEALINWQKNLWFSFLSELLFIGAAWFLQQAKCRF